MSARRAREGAHAADEGGHPLHAVEPDGRGVHARRACARSLEVLAKHDCWLIVDEIYAELVYDGFKHVSAAKIAPDLRDAHDHHRRRVEDVRDDGLAHRLVASRPQPLAKALDIVQGQSTTNADGGRAARGASPRSRGPQRTSRAMRATFEKRRNAMVKGLNSIPGVSCRMPEGAFYAFADCSGLYGLD